VIKVEKTTAAYYRRCAMHLLMSVESAPTAKSQTAYLELAAIWIELAQRAALLEEEMVGARKARGGQCYSLT
jgi:hypothetical protein